MVTLSRNYDKMWWHIFFNDEGPPIFFYDYFVTTFFHPAMVWVHLCGLPTRYIVWKTVFIFSFFVVAVAPFPWYRVTVLLIPVNRDWDIEKKHFFLNNASAVSIRDRAWQKKIPRREMTFTPLSGAQMYGVLNNLPSQMASGRTRLFSCIDTEEAKFFFF